MIYFEVKAPFTLLSSRGLNIWFQLTMSVLIMVQYVLNGSSQTFNAVKGQMSHIADSILPALCGFAEKKGENVYYQNL